MNNFKLADIVCVTFNKNEHNPESRIGIISEILDSVNEGYQIQAADGMIYFCYLNLDNIKLLNDEKAMLWKLEQCL